MGFVPFDIPCRKVLRFSAGSFIKEEFRQV